MPDRVIRDELLRSHRYVTLSSDTARLLFLHLILCADSFGNAEATTTAIGLAMCRPVDEATAAKLLSELADVDLIRVYQADAKRYVHLPRWRQRLRYLNGMHPRPPSAIECNEIKALIRKVGIQSGRSRDSVGRSEVKRREVKHSPSIASRFDEWWAGYPRKVAKQAAQKAWTKLAPDDDLAAKLLAAVAVQKVSDDWTREGGRFIPHPATWLNGRRWEDETEGAGEPAWK